MAGWLWGLIQMAEVELGVTRWLLIQMVGNYMGCAPAARIDLSLCIHMYTMYTMYDRKIVSNPWMSWNIQPANLSHSTIEESCIWIGASADSVVKRSPPAADVRALGQVAPPSFAFRKIDDDHDRSGPNTSKYTIWIHLSSRRTTYHITRLTTWLAWWKFRWRRSLAAAQKNCRCLTETIGLKHSYHRPNTFPNHPQACADNTHTHIHTHT